MKYDDLKELAVLARRADRELEAERFALLHSGRYGLEWAVRLERASRRIVKGNQCVAARRRAVLAEAEQAGVFDEAPDGPIDEYACRELLWS